MSLFSLYFKHYRLLGTLIFYYFGFFWMEKSRSSILTSNSFNWLILRWNKWNLIIQANSNVHWIGNIQYKCRYVCKCVCVWILAGGFIQFTLSPTKSELKLENHLSLKPLKPNSHQWDNYTFGQANSSFFMYVCVTNCNFVF